MGSLEQLVQPRGVEGAALEGDRVRVSVGVT